MCDDVMFWCRDLRRHTGVLSGHSASAVVRPLFRCGQRMVGGAVPVGVSRSRCYRVCSASVELQHDGTQSPAVCAVHSAGHTRHQRQRCRIFARCQADLHSCRRGH